MHVEHRGVLTNIIATRPCPSTIMIRAIQIARAHPLQDQVARHFEQEVADEEDPAPSP